MPFRSVLLNVRDVAASVAFYRRYLGARPIAVREEAAELDVVTGTLRLVRVADPGPTTWVDDDRQRGFRHVGFKVARLEPWTDPLRAAGVRFHIEPCDAVGGLRIAFFYDPDGTLLELVEGNPEYDEVLDADLVAAERAVPVPDRPRFDHVALTVPDVPAAVARWRPLGFRAFGTLVPPGDARGLHLTDLRSGDTVLELFAFADPTHAREPQLGAPGFQAAVVGDADVPAGTVPEGFRPVGDGPDGSAVLADDDGLLVVLDPGAPMSPVTAAVRPA